MKNIDEWNKYWLSNSNTQSVFTDLHGEGFKELSLYWKTIFNKQNKNSRIADIGCGTGAIFSCIDALESYQLMGIDCSFEPLNILSSKFPTVSTFLNTENHLESCDLHKFTTVVSQFGVEYLGVEVFTGIPSLLSSNASLYTLSHIHGGHIHSRYSAELKAILILTKCSLYSKIEESIKELFANGVSDLLSEFLLFLDENYDIWCGGTLHFVNGFKQLVERFRQYNESDIIQWFNGIDAQLKEAMSRMSIMCEAALRESDIKNIISKTNQLGDWDYSPFFIKNKELPVAWSITFKKY
ncbi:hypothetical protein J3L16_05675 [Alteromonas sp. 5E99-2]|uniref:hypothetical protein n=1 Tax=Alteromonas sp. 5E99-2 TaxID=2817683 RepID=UPI001A99DACB|nr:hypothetical protein [Alteromonas sp. 5E99-2]MBO1255176.1 hypothetical protein [Alteromonas sp. 5E99-2]